MEHVRRIKVKPRCYLLWRPCLLSCQARLWLHVLPFPIKWPPLIFSFLEFSFQGLQESSADVLAAGRYHCTFINTEPHCIKNVNLKGPVSCWTFDSPSARHVIQHSNHGGVTGLTCNTPVKGCSQFAQEPEGIGPPGSASTPAVQGLISFTRSMFGSALMFWLMFLM